MITVSGRSQKSISRRTVMNHNIDFISYYSAFVLHTVWELSIHWESVMTLNRVCSQVLKIKQGKEERKSALILATCVEKAVIELCSKMKYTTTDGRRGNDSFLIAKINNLHSRLYKELCPFFFNQALEENLWLFADFFFLSSSPSLQAKGDASLLPT